jgi:hypothetical protein
VNIVGYVFLGIIAVAVVVGIALAIRSIPEIARYLRIRKM